MNNVAKYAKHLKWLTPVVGGTVGATWYRHKQQPGHVQSNCSINPIPTTTTTPPTTTIPPTTTKIIKKDVTKNVNLQKDMTTKQIEGSTVSVLNGEKLFKQRCAQCHTIQEGGPNKQGPNLHGLLGRSAGTVSGFPHSKANKESGIVWTDTNLFEYLENPRKFMPGTKMSFPGLKSEQDRLDLIAYLKKM